jgi:hypothetical protein
MKKTDSHASDVRRIEGNWADFSLDMLLTLATRAGLKPSLRLAA